VHPYLGIRRGEYALRQPGIKESLMSYMLREYNPNDPQDAEK